MAAGALGSIIGQRIEQLDKRDRYLPRRSVRLSLAFTICAVVLGACAWDPPTIERTPREAAGAESGAKSRLAARKGVPQNGTASGGPAGEKIEVPGTEMAALEVDLTNFKERLIGLDSDEISDLMGTPGLERAEPPALIWQYRHQVCTVDIFMFDDGGGATVDHVEVRPTSGSGVNEKECFTALLRNVPQASAKAPAGQPIAPAPSTPVTRRAGAPAAAPAAAMRPPVPSTAAPSAAPVLPAARPPAAPAAATGDDDGPPPTDTDVDFDFGPSNAAPSGAPSGAPAPAAPNRSPSAAPSSEAIPTLPPELSDEMPSGAKPAAPPAPSSSLGIDTPPTARAHEIDEFSDPVASTAPPASAKPPVPAPAPLAAVPPAPVVAPPPAAAPGPAQLAPRAPTATAAAQPKGASKGTPKGAAARQAEDIDDDLPPDALTGRRDDDPANNNEDMVE